MNSTPVTADGASGAITLVRGPNKISVEATTLAASTTIIVQSKLDGDGTQYSQHQDPQDATTPAQLDAADTISGGGYAREFVLYGPGVVRAYAVNFSTSTGVVLRAERTSIQ